MTNPTLAHLYVLLDRSGSMQAIQADAEAALDAFVAEQRRAPGQCAMTLAQFDSRYEEVYVNRPVAEVPPLHLEPRGMTALFDAVGVFVTAAGERLASLPEHERPGTVIVVMVTDGMENTSTVWSQDAVRGLVEQQSSTYSWDFLYLGGDQDAVAVGGGIGVPRERSMSFERGRVRAAIAAASGAVAAARAAAASGLPREEVRPLLVFTDAQRSECARP